jgi:hypothetical protein
MRIAQGKVRTGYGDFQIQKLAISTDIFVVDRPVHADPIFGVGTKI